MTPWEAALRVFAVVARWIPDAWHYVRGRRTAPNLQYLTIEAKIANLSESARILLWHLADGIRRSGPVLAEVLREARRTEPVDRVIAELRAAGLTDSDFPGNQFIPSEILSAAQDIIRKGGR